MTSDQKTCDNRSPAPPHGHTDDATQAPTDGRQSEAALAVRRGVTRLLRGLDMAPLYEIVLASGRRADVMAVGRAGEIWIVEVKSCLADFRSDAKWPDYRDYCDRLFFAVAPDFPREVLPEDAGLILADRYAGEIVRPAPEHKLAGGRRRALLLAFARTGAMRLSAVIDPAIAAGEIPRA